MNKKILVIVMSLLLISIAIGYFVLNDKPNQQKSDLPTNKSETDIEFANLNPKFRFSSKVPNGWRATEVPQIESIAIYDTTNEAQIFIRYFEADQFLTLSTVDILEREQFKIGNHDAVRYEIKKKAGVPNFPYQPAWRNEQHEVTDIRFSKNNPSLFYVFARNPKLSKVEFNKFINFLVFHNDFESLAEPIKNSSQRVTKKPFGIYVEPNNSPVNPEKFTGYHNAVDYEILSSEEGKDISIFAVCGGEVRELKSAQGYGGVLIQDCLFENQPITVIYGHIKLSSANRKSGEYLLLDERIAVLGEAFSNENGDERKHLHLGIKKGSLADIRGYVPREELNEWINFENLRDSNLPIISKAVN